MVHTSSLMLFLNANRECVCGNKGCQNAARSCIQSTCTVKEMGQALDLKEEHC